MKNRTASIQSKLRSIAQNEGETYQLILVRYFVERLIYRISVSDYKRNFCLKGGSLLYAIEQEKSRPTMDVDFLGIHLSNEHAQLKAIFRKISQIEYPNDAVELMADSISASVINKEGAYAGVRIKLEGRLGTIRQLLQIDIGFGDIVTPSPIEMDYPTLLAMDSPHILAYSTESIIAEKFEAMIDLANQNSRMKDFYDVYRLLHKGNYQPSILSEAVFATFQKRATAFTEAHTLFSEDFALNEKRQQQWKAFLMQLDRQGALAASVALPDALALIKDKLYPIYAQLTLK